MSPRRQRPWRILVVDDEQLACDQITEKLTATKFVGSKDPPDVVATRRFSDAIALLEDRRFDLIILDVRAGRASSKHTQLHAGIRTLERIKKTRFLPVIFFTGVAHLVDDRDSFPLISVVKKTAGVQELAKRVADVFRSGLPSVSRLLVVELEAVERDYMWDFAARNWDAIEGLRDPSRLAKVLAARIAASMELIDTSAAKPQAIG